MYNFTDLVLLLVCSWLLGFQRRRKIGVFLSDISGAFDRVKTTKLLAKMRRLGICETLMAFFEDYLEPREAHVAVDGAQSFSKARSSDPASGIYFLQTSTGPLSRMELKNADLRTISAVPKNLQAQ